MADQVSEGMVIVDIWGPPQSSDHVARFYVTGIRNADMKWLRSASLDHEGHLPGMPWSCCPHAFERLLAHAFIERFEVKALHRDEVYLRAVITDKGRAALAEAGAIMQAYVARAQAEAATGDPPPAQAAAE